MGYNRGEPDPFETSDNGQSSRQYASNSMRKVNTWGQIGDNTEPNHPRASLLFPRIFNCSVSVCFALRTKQVKKKKVFHFVITEF